MRTNFVPATFRFEDVLCDKWPRTWLWAMGGPPSTRARCITQWRRNNNIHAVLAKWCRKSGWFDMRHFHILWYNFLKFIHHLDTHNTPKFVEYEHPTPIGSDAIEYRFACYKLYISHFYSWLYQIPISGDIRFCYITFLDISDSII